METGTIKKDSLIIRDPKSRRSLKNNSCFPGNIFKCLIFSGLCLFCSACGETAFYEKYQSIENRYWQKNAEYFFTFEITDTTVPYDLTVEIRNNNLFPYQNLWLFSMEEQPTGVVRRDTMECTLADDYGKWLGTGISLYHTSFPLHTQYHFPDTGIYTIGLRQGMRNDSLPGIQKIGLSIRKHK